MQQPELRYEDFLFDVHPAHQGMVNELNDELMKRGCVRKIEMAKSGYLVSYSDGKRALLNYVFRKSGLVMRIYADHLAEYSELLPALPEAMRKKIAKAPACRRLLDPAKCNQRCPLGYTFELDGELHKKCRYNCFLLPVDDVSAPHLRELVGRELAARA